MSQSQASATGVLGDPVTVPHGGTGQVALTDGAIVVGNGVDPVTLVGPLTDGQIPIGSTVGVDPVPGTITPPAAGITVTNGPGSITLGLANDLAAVEGLGTTGIAVRAAANTWTTRQITSADGSVTITNPAGIAGDIDLSVAIMGVDEMQIYHVGKHGNDANSGLTIGTAKLTFGNAITTAVASVPGAANRFAIVCIDDGIYTENITCAQYVDIYAPNAALIGTITGADDCSVKFRAQSIATGTIGIVKTAGAGYFFIDIDDITAAGTGVCIVCTSGFLNAAWKRMTIVNGFGIGDITSVLEHIHIKGGDIYVNGTGTAIARANAGTTVGHVDHILDAGGGNGRGIYNVSGTMDIEINKIDAFLTGIEVDAGTVNISVQELSCTTGYDVANGATLKIFANTFSGLKTVAGGGIVYEVILGTPIEVIQGGTGAGTLTDHGVLIGSGTAAVTPIAVGGTGELLVGAAGADPAFATSATGDFTFTSATAGATRTFTVSNTDNTNAASAATIVASTGGASAGDAKYQATTTTTTWSWGVDNSVTVPTADTFVLSQDASLGTKNVISADTNGIISYPLQSAFLADDFAGAGANQTGDGTAYTMVCATEIADQNADFDGTSTFTAPVTGLYQLSQCFNLTGLAAGNTGTNFYLTTSNRVYGLLNTTGGTFRAGDSIQYNSSMICDMDAADTATVGVVVSGGAKIVDVYGKFGGVKVT